MSHVITIVCSFPNLENHFSGKGDTENDSTTSYKNIPCVCSVHIPSCTLHNVHVGIIRDFNSEMVGSWHQLYHGIT